MPSSTPPSGFWSGRAQRGISTRRLAREAGQNHGLVHYYFGSVDELLLQALEPFTNRVLDRQRAMYEADAPFAEKWRTAVAFIEEDLAAGYPKVWAELEALAGTGRSCASVLTA